MTASTDLDDTLANIRARAEAATEGPWFAASDDGDPVVLAASGDLEHVVDFRLVKGGRDQGFADAEFIASARTDVTRLLDLLDEQRAVIARVRDWLAAHPTTHDVRQTEGYWRAQNDLRALLDGADTTTTDGSEA